MRIIFITITSVFLLFSLCFASTNVPGGSVTGTWTLAGSPYLVQGAIMVPSGSTLTIEPGVTVNFQGSYKFYIQGRLLAIGTISDSITFTSSDISTGWLGIRFDNTPITNDTSKLIYCKIQYCKLTGTSNDANGGGLYFKSYSKAIISNCNISYNSATSLSGNGGGICCDQSSPVIRDNTISFNSAIGYGGGIYCVNCNTLSISYNNISHNSASSLSIGFGGGIYCYECTSPIISNNTISYNQAGALAGGIYSYNSNPLITNNIIQFNSVEGAGGGVRIIIGGTITDNIITNNSATSSNGVGGGIYCNANTTIVIKNNIISNNSADGYGGGICNTYPSSPNISNNIITNNSCGTMGGGIYCNGSNPIITNNTISNNSAASGGALYCSNNSDPVFNNSILWGNTASTGGNQVYLFDENSEPTFYYCDIQGDIADFGLNGVFYTGIYQNNINAIPLFVSPSISSGSGYDGINADWTLQNGSPCINAGNPSGNYPATDLAGNPRIIGNRIDIGAYEYQGTGDIASVNNLKDFYIYPNPATDKAIILIPNKATIEFLTINGHVIKSIICSSNSALVDLKDLTSGVYFVRAITNNEIAIKKFIKE